MNKELAKKFKIKPGHSLLIVNSPDGFLSRSSKADTKLSAGKRYDFINIFVRAQADIDKLIPHALKALKEDGLLWIAYPKKSSTVKTDLTRNTGWDTLKKMNYEAVSQVAIDEVWSALRFRRVEKIKSAKYPTTATDRKKFTAIIEKPDDGIDGGYISIPFDVEKVYGSKGQIKVKAWFDGYLYRGVLANIGTGCHVIIVRKDIRMAIGKNAGDKITVELERDDQERTIDVPMELEKKLAQSKAAKKFFDALSYTNRKEYVVWITSAKNRRPVISGSPIRFKNYWKAKKIQRRNDQALVIFLSHKRASRIESKYFTVSTRVSCVI
jgi:hypothetical protein